MVPEKPGRGTGDPMARGRSAGNGDDLTSQADAAQYGANQSANATDGPQLGDRAAQVADSAKQTVSSATSSVQQQATQQLEGRKGQAVTSLEQVEQAFHQVGGQLSSNNQPQLGQAAEMAANQVARLSGYLRQRSIGDLLDDVQDLGRRQPVLFLAGSFLLGIAGARFLKASARQVDSTTSGRLGTTSRGTSADTWTRGTRAGAPAIGRQSPNYGVYDPGSQGVVVRELPQ